MTLRSRRQILAGLALSLLGALAVSAGPQRLSPAETRARFHRLLDRPRVDLDPTVSARTENGLVIETGRFHSEASEWVPFLSVRREAASGRLPAVIVLHG